MNWENIKGELIKIKIGERICEFKEIFIEYSIWVWLLIDNLNLWEVKVEKKGMVGSSGSLEYRLWIGRYIFFGIGRRLLVLNIERIE